MGDWVAEEKAIFLDLCQVWRLAGDDLSIGRHVDYYNMISKYGLEQ